MRHLPALSTLIALIACAGLIGCGDEDAADTAAMDDTTAMTHAEPMADNAMGMRGDTLRANLAGAAEVPGPGDEDGSGEALVWVDDNQVCYDITVSGIGDPAASHIHAGSASESGAPVVNFNIGDNGLSGCVDAEAQTIQNIRSSPSQYYVNVHTSEFGAGAVRGQLQ